MKILIFILVGLFQNDCFSLKDVAKLLAKDNEETASYVISRGYYLSPQTDQRVKSFNNDNKAYPSIAIFYKDAEAKKPIFVELSVTSENIKDYECFDSALKRETHKVKTYFDKTQNNYVTKYSNTSIDIYVITFQNTYGRRVIRCAVCRKGESPPLEF